MPKLELDETAQHILNLAVQEAYKLDHTSVSSAHLFLAFARDPEGLLAKALTQLSFSAEGLRMLIRQTLVPGRAASAISAESLSQSYAESVQRALDVAQKVAERDQASTITERHLLVAFLTSGLGTTAHLLRQIGLDPAALLSTIEGRPVVIPVSVVRPPQAAAGTPPEMTGRRGPPEQSAGREDQLNLASFDASAQSVLTRAAQEAACAHAGLGTPHFVIALLEQPNGFLPALVSQQGYAADSLADALRRAHGYEWPATPLPPPLITAQVCSARVRRILDLAGQLARQASASLIGEKHLMAAFIREGGGSTAQALARLGVNWSEIEVALQQAGDTPPRTARTPLLDKYGRDLTQAARQGKLNQVVGRQRELEQIIHILIKGTKNNPVLVGEAGVGKTAVVEALAQHIVEGQVPPALRDRRLIEITLSGLVAGTRYRGDFEERLQRLMAEVRSNSDVLIFIDEIHTLVGAGDAGGNLDAANILKPALARGELHCIGATTPAEYQRTIAQDAALARRFQQVKIDEPSPEETLHILQATRARYESRYGVQLTPEALAAAVQMSVQYLPEQHLPDKARDLIEEACARVSVGTMGRWAADEGETAAPKTVTPSTIAQIIAERKGLPVEQLTASEQQRLLELGTRLKARVIGQDVAVSVVTRAVRLARTGLKDPGRPSGVFLFVGPTGVGKTELAKALAGELFGSDDQLIRFDMSEFMEPHSVAKLIGAPPGYVGYREEGQLVRELRRKPYSVVLIDEIEKAAPNIFDLFLQLFDEGRLTDAQGNHVDGRHAIYILTSNVGTELIGRIPLGFTASRVGDETLQQELQNRLRQTFRPEFLNRIDEVVIFLRLQPEHIRVIALHQTEALQERVRAEHGVRLQVDPEVVDLICSEGYSETMGARPLRRAIMRLLAAPVSEWLLSHPGGDIVARVADGRIVLEKAGGG